jgi:hypothetical protein
VFQMLSVVALRYVVMEIHGGNGKIKKTVFERRGPVVYIYSARTS